MGISIDRNLAIERHLRYQAIVTHKRLVEVVIFIWSLSAFSSSTFFLFPYAVLITVVSSMRTICLTVSSVINWKIRLITQRHVRQIQVQQVQEPGAQPRRQHSEMRNLVRIMKIAITAFYKTLRF